jgi:hypothetical protein
MRYLCEGYTTGGPIAILQHPYLRLWDGKDDYFQAVNEPRTGAAQFVLKFKNICPLCIFHQESDGNFSVYYDSQAFMVLSEISADEGHEIRHHMPLIALSMLRGPSVNLKGFGGKIVVFDAAIAGNAIRLHEVGCSRADSDLRDGPHRYDVALIEVAVGDWTASELYYEGEYLTFNGVLFELVR